MCENFTEIHGIRLQFVPVDAKFFYQEEYRYQDEFTNAHGEVFTDTSHVFYERGIMVAMK